MSEISPPRVPLLDMGVGSVVTLAPTGMPPLLSDARLIARLATPPFNRDLSSGHGDQRISCR